MTGEEQRVNVLAIEQIQFHLDKAKEAFQNLGKAGELAVQLHEQAREKITEFALAVKMGKIDEAALQGFFKKPYPRLEQVRDAKNRIVPDTWKLAIPKFIPLQVGFLESQDDGYNYFRVNRYMDWFGEIPDFVKKQVGWKDPPDLKLEGEELLGAPEAVEAFYRRHRDVVEKKDGRVIINQQRYYDVVVALLKEGVKPFPRQPVDPADLVERKCDYELRPYQNDVWSTLLEYSRLGVFWAPSVGKTVIGVWGLTHLKPPHLITVPTLMLKEQWEDRIEEHTDLKLGEEVFVETYQMAIKKFAKFPVTLKIYDEVHHIGAKYYIKLFGIPSKYSLGLSATPYREDEGGEELIYALTGYPTGLAWQYFRDMKLIRSPICNVWVEKNADAKTRRLDILLQESKKTIIFCDFIDMGKRIAARWNVPFVHGATKERLQTIKDAQLSVVSRVGDEGVSLPELERVIEYSFNWGSRRQELQRFGRLLHSQMVEQEHHIIMTLEEFAHDKKRLYSVMEKGFKVSVKREGITEKEIERTESAPRKPRTIAEKRIAPPREVQQPQAPVPSNPLLSSVGVQKAMTQMKGMEKRAFEFLINNDTAWITDEKLAFHMGSVNKLALQKNIRFQWMLKQGWIERKKIEGKMASRTRFREITG